MKRLNMLIASLMVACLMVGSYQKSKTSKKHRNGYLNQKVQKKNSISIDPLQMSSRRAKKAMADTGEAKVEDTVKLFNSTFMKEYQSELSQPFLFRKLRNGQETDDYLLSQKMFTLNQYGLYVHEPNDKTLNGLDDMIRLDEMVSPDDVTQIRSALPTLSNILGNIEMVNVQAQQYQGQFPCFTIKDNENPEQDWQVCDFVQKKDEHLASSLALFRAAIVNKVVMHIQYKNNMRFTLQVSLTDEELAASGDVFDGWSYEKQEGWGGQCKDSLQSPIDIITSEVLATTKDIQIQTFYKGDRSTSAYMGTNDRFLVGKFGYALYQNAIDGNQGYYCPWRIEFKYNAEHQLDSATPSQLEVLVYHRHNIDKTYISGQDTKVANGCDRLTTKTLRAWQGITSEQQERDLTSEYTQLVVSFLVNNNMTTAEDETGIFWQGLAVTNFVGDELSKPYSLTPLVKGQAAKDSHVETLASLEGLVDDGLTQRFQHSFYFYTGSLSQPGCDDNIKRIVMYNEIQVNSQLFGVIRDKVLDGFTFKQNYRKPLNKDKGTMQGYKVFKHIDISQKQNCPTSQILKKYTNKDYKAKLNDGQFVDYEKLLLATGEEEKLYSNAYQKLNQEANGEIKKEASIKNAVTEFNHEVSISTKMHHVHKVPKKLIKKIFGNEVKHGSIVKLGRADQDLSVTYLGDNVKDYTLNVADKEFNGNGEGDAKITEAQEVINKHDQNKLEKEEDHKVINQNNLSNKAKEEFAEYLVQDKNKEQNKGEKAATKTKRR